MCLRLWADEFGCLSSPLHPPLPTCSEAELTHKLVACERTVESLLARLEEVESAHNEAAAMAAHLPAQLAAAEEAEHTARLQAAAWAAHAEEVEGELRAAR